MTVSYNCGYIEKALNQKLDKELFVGKIISSVCGRSPGYILFDNGLCLLWGTSSSSTSAHYTYIYPPIKLQWANAYGQVWGVSVDSGGYTVRVDDNNPAKIEFKTFLNDKPSAGIAFRYFIIGLQDKEGN